MTERKKSFMSKFTYENYLNSLPKVHEAKLTDDLKVVATIYRDGEIILEAVYKGSSYTISFNDQGVDDYYRYWDCKTKTARLYSLELRDECEIDH